MKSALIAKFRDTFGRAPELIARAPGRIEFIGNHTDYNGGIVLGAAIDRGVWVALARRDDRRWNFASGQKDGVVRLQAGEMLKQSGAGSWVNYPLGVMHSLHSFGLPAPEAFDYFAISDLPLGAGLSSSAAIEMASALAFTSAMGVEPLRETLVKAARDAENNFVGVPCGILDQGVSGFGRKDHLVFIDCRGPRFDTVPLPKGAHFWIFNTHTKHALVDGLYAERHRECMEAAKTLGVSLLVDASPSMLAAAKDRLSPVIERRARHIIHEIGRVAQTVTALRRGDLAGVGALLVASHRSSQTLFENSTPELDLLVDALIVCPHVYGARLTGGGFGGAVMALTSPDFGDADAAEVAGQYEKRFGARPDILHTQTANGAEVIMRS
jgi:galactokinase